MENGIFISTAMSSTDLLKVYDQSKSKLYFTDWVFFVCHFVYIKNLFDLLDLESDSKCLQVQDINTNNTRHLHDTDISAFDEITEEQEVLIDKTEILPDKLSMCGKLDFVIQFIFNLVRLIFSNLSVF